MSANATVAEVKRDKPWIIRTYAGHSNAKESNALYRGNLAKGQTGLSVAFAVVASRRTKNGPSALNQGAQGLVGRDYSLVAPIVAGEGRIRVNDTLWRVTGPDAPMGARVRVTGVEGTLLTVVPV